MLKREYKLYTIFRLNRRTFDILLVKLIEYRLEVEVVRTLTIAERLLYFLYIIG